MLVRILRLKSWSSYLGQVKSRDPENNKHGITWYKEDFLLVVLETEIYSIYVISFWIIAAYMILNHPQ